MFNKSAGDPEDLGLRGRLNFLAKDSVLYGMSGGITKCFALITFPLLSRHFGISDYGIIDMFGVLATALAVFLGFGQNQTIARFFYERKDRDHQKNVISLAFLNSLVVALLTLPVLWLIIPFAARRMTGIEEAESLLKLIVLCLPFMVVTNLVLFVCKFSFARFRYLVMTVGNGVARLLALLIALFVFDIGVVGVFVLNLVLSLLFSTIGIIFIREWLVVPRELRLLRSVLPYTLPLWVIQSITAFLLFYERSLLEDLLGSADLGLYAAGAKVALLLALPISAFLVAWQPFAMSIHQGKEVARTYNLILRASTFGMLIMVIFLDAMSRYILLILAGADFEGGALVVFPLAMAAALGLVVKIVGIGLQISNKSGLRLFAYLVYLPISLVAIYLFAREMGLPGVAFGVLFGQTALLVIESWFSCRHYRISWSFPRIGMSCLVVLVAGILMNMLGGDASRAGMVAIKSGWLIVFFVLGWYLLFNGYERGQVVGVLRTALGRLGGRS